MVHSLGMLIHGMLQMSLGSVWLNKLNRTSQCLVNSKREIYRQFPDLNYRIVPPKSPPTPPPPPQKRSLLGLIFCKEHTLGNHDLIQFFHPHPPPLP